MEPSSVHILMTGAGAPGAAGIIRCLKAAPWVKLTVADTRPDAVGRYLTDSFATLPLGDDPAFCDSVLSLCQERGITMVMPLVTRELGPFARERDRFRQEGIRVLVSPEPAIRISNNKAACYDFLSRKGVELPRFFLVRTKEEFIHAAFELGHPNRSFCFKPSSSNGSRGVRIVSDSLDESDLLFHHKPYHHQISYAHALSILSAKPFPELLVSECLPGDEYSIDCLANQGKAILVVPRLREKMVNGISIQGRFVKDEGLMDYCRSIIAAIGLHGNIGIQVKGSEGGKHLLLEINPRVQGTIVAALGAGVNLPLLAVKQELGWALPEEETRVAWGTRFLRYWTEVFY